MKFNNWEQNDNFNTCLVQFTLERFCYNRDTLVPLTIFRKITLCHIIIRRTGSQGIKVTETSYC